MNDQEMKEFEAYKAAKAQQEEAAKKLAEEEKMQKMIVAAVAAATAKKEMPEPPKLDELPPKFDITNPLANLNKEQLRFIATNYIDAMNKGLMAKNDAQIAKLLICAAGFFTFGASQFGMAAGIGVGFLFMVAGAAWYMFGQKDVNIGKKDIADLKKKYSL